MGARAARYQGVSFIWSLPSSRFVLEARADCTHMYDKLRHSSTGTKFLSGPRAFDQAQSAARFARRVPACGSSV
jgi:hypothetical protein